MLTKAKREMIRNTNQFEVFFKEIEGVPYSMNKPTRIPDVEEIRQDAINQLLKLGFERVEVVESKKANCIIRVFTKRHFKYGNGEIHNVYGFNCFVKEDGIWLSESSNVFKIDFAKHHITCLLFHEEAVDYYCDFVDTYVKIM